MFIDKKKTPRGSYDRSPEQIERLRTMNIGRIPWNKGKKGSQVPWNKGLKGYMAGEKNGMWNGGPRQARQEKIAGRPKPIYCEVCYEEGAIDFDHCHKDMHFRGWICRRCNLVLGMVKDNQKLLRNLALYLDFNYDETRPRSLLYGRLHRNDSNSEAS